MPTRSAYPILSVEAARERILSFVPRLEPIEIAITEALGRVLSQDVAAPNDIPPLANSAMDGYALRSDDLVSGTYGAPARLKVVGELGAGAVWQGQIGPGQALRIMTGAPVPLGADTVVRFEDTTALEGGEQVIINVAPSPGRNVRAAGEDVQAGQIVLRQGQALRPQEIGMLASVGCPQVHVYRQPRVAILATGDEVWPIDQPLQPGKIRNINSYTNAAQVQAAGGEPHILSIAPDQREALAGRLQRALDLRADLIVTSGGVSVGEFDLVKQVLSTQGEIDFWWVNMKPGRPMAFGTLNNVPLLALPGNPVAAMISFFLFGQPAVRKMLGYTTWPFPSVQARLAEPVTRKDDRRHYLRVQLAGDESGLVARLTGDQGSGILTSMVQADGLAVIPEEVDHLAAGSLVQVLLFD